MIDSHASAAASRLYHVDERGGETLVLTTQPKTPPGRTALTILHEEDLNADGLADAVVCEDGPGDRSQDAYYIAITGSPPKVLSVVPGLRPSLAPPGTTPPRALHFSDGAGRDVWLAVNDGVLVQVPGSTSAAQHAKGSPECGTPPRLDPPWRAAGLSDFTTGAAEIALNPGWACPHVNIDVDADGLPDTIVLAIDEARRLSAVVAVLAAGGQRVLREDSAAPVGATQLITSPLAVKPAGGWFGGEHGYRDRDGLPVATEVVRAVSGVQACTPLEPRKRFKFTDDASDLCHCTELLWIEGDNVKSARACD